jgi:beta-xylosidase
MSNTNTGGPAFPQSYQHTEVAAKMYESGELTAGQLKKASSQLAGMTLRDYFAAKAMQADLMGGVHRDDFGVTAKRAYIMADTMLEARGV